MAPGKLLVFPNWRDNPYLNMLYLAALGAGWRLEGVQGYPRLLDELGKVDAASVVHLHWTGPVCRDAATEAEAFASVEELSRALARAKDLGATIVWTVHNGLPHDAEFEAAEIELNRRLADLADVVHVLSEHTAAYVSRWYTLPADRVVRIPHASYHGLYDRSVGREEARERLGLRPQDKAVLFFGQMRPYKGLDSVVAATAAARAKDPDVVLLLAGHTRETELATIEAMLPEGLRTVREHRFVDDVDVQVWLNAADVMTLPYKRILNSGSMYLAATFGLPVILPGQPHLQDSFGDEAWVHLYDEEADTEQLGDALLEAMTHGPEQREAATAFARRYTPYEMATDYLELLRSLPSS